MIKHGNDTIKSVNKITFDCILDTGEQVKLIVDTEFVNNVFTEYINGIDNKSLTVHIEGDFTFGIEK